MRGATCVPPGTWFDPAINSTIGIQHLLTRVRTKDIVLLGETHAIGDHHRWHLQTVAQLHALNPDLILGFEAFPRRVQNALDRWVAGELSEKEFIQESDWETVWKYDVNFYMPLFHFARMNKIPMVALNVDRALIRKVSSDGWKNVPQNQRRGIGDPKPASQPYIDMLGEVYGQHSTRSGKESETNGPPKGPGLEDPMFSNFVDVQLTWDRAMAEAANTAVKTARAKGRAPQLVAIVGRGHMDNFLGIPEQLKDLGQSNFAVLTPWDKMRKCADLTNQNGTAAADAVYGIALTKDTFSAAKPKLGVLIENGDDGVLVGAVVKKSIAEKAGIKKDDVILEAAGQKVTKVGELISIIKSVSPGTWLPLHVKRGKEMMELVAQFPSESEPDKPKTVHGKK
ncbi:MAG: ChaN family lipoprotein [Magnetovibrio sp.]|nr:ChaN family lipoprotein [Magnetovibrio sp.]